MGLLKTALITAPTAEPLRLGDVKDHLRIERGETVEDDLLKSLIKTARQRVEDITNRKLINQTWKVYLDGWPNSDAITLPYAPLSTGTAPAITYLDSTGGSNTFSTTGWRCDSVTEPNRVVLTYAQDWPTASLDNSNPINVQFKCGYGTASSDVPDQIRTAMKIVVADLYENRESILVGRTVTEVPNTVNALLASYRLRSF